MEDTRKQKLQRFPLKVDIHAHLGLDGNGQGHFTVNDRLEFHRFMGIEHAVILPYPAGGGRWSADDGIMGTQEARETAERDPEHFSWFCSVFPDGTRKTRDQLEEYRAQGAKGVGELGVMLPFDDFRISHLLSCCGELGLPVLFHISPMGAGAYGVVDDPGLPRLERALATHPATTFIAHSQPFWYELSTYDKTIPAERLNGFPFERVTEEGRAVELLKKYPNLYADLSAISGSNAILRDPEYGVKFLEEFQDKLMFGTDQVNHDMVFPIGPMLDYYLLSGRITRQAYDKICRQNAERLLGLPNRDAQP